MKTETRTILTDLETLALSKVVDAKSVKIARDNVEPGKGQVVDIVTRSRVTLNIAEDHEANVTAAIPDKKFVIWMLSKMAPQVRDKTVREFKAELDAGVVDAISKGAKAEALEAWAEIADSTRKTVRGRVTVADIEITPIRPEVVDAAEALIETAN